MECVESHPAVLTCCNYLWKVTYHILFVRTGKIPTKKYLQNAGNEKALFECI